jgi:hypothetical protein
LISRAKRVVTFLRHLGLILVAVVLAGCGVAPANQATVGTDLRGNDRLSHAGTSSGSRTVQACSWKIRESGKTLLFKVPHRRAVHLLHTDGSVIRPIFTGKVDGVPARVTLWRSPGSLQEKRAEIKEMEREQDELGRLNVEGATDGDAPSTSSGTFAEPTPMPTAHTRFQTHAYRAEYDGRVEYGAFGRAKVAISVEGRQPKTRDGCARVDDRYDHEARVASRGGSFAAAPWDGNTRRDQGR